MARKNGMLFMECSALTGKNVHKSSRNITTFNFALELHGHFCVREKRFFRPQRQRIAYFTLKLDS